jgi:hypothetical protein
MKKFAILIFIQVIFNLYPFVDSRCGLDLLKKPKRVLVEQEIEGDVRNLNSASWKPLKIHLDFSMIENNIGKFDKNDLRDLKERIMPKAQNVLEGLFKVKQFQSKLKLTADHCEQIPIPEQYKSEGIDADLIIFVTIDDSGFFLQNHVEAAAIHCLQDSVTKRPIAGYIQFKPQLKVDNTTAVDYMVWLALHEITHILVFNDALYPDWVDDKNEPLELQNVIGGKILKNGKKMNYIKTPNVLKKGKEHFGCDQFMGIPLEYNGGPGTAGAHWSKKYMNTDYMIGDSYGENLISELTLAMFEDSGWYSVDYELSNLFIWGKNKGCDFFSHSHKCVELKENSVETKFKDEFCTKLNYPVCSTSHIFRGNCRGRTYTKIAPFERYFKDQTIGGSDSLTDKCPIPIEVKKGQNYYGGSCRVGQTLTVQQVEQVCPECACFMSNLRLKGTKLENIADNKNKKKLLRPNRGGPKSEDDDDDIGDDEKPSSSEGNSTITDDKKSEDTKAGRSFNFMKQALMPLPELSDNDFAAQCYEFKCEESKLIVKIAGKEYKCSGDGTISLEGYSGLIKCPPADVLCHPKFKCKFGCVEKYDNSVGFRSFSK